MAGPVATYLATQQAAQTAFNVPFGLLTVVNNAITAATARGEFNATVDCSLFVTEDVSNLRIYLDSLGYVVQFAKGTNEKGLNIDWGRFRDTPGTAVTVFQGTSPWIIAGTVDQGAPGGTPWPVSISSFPGSLTVDQGAPGTSPWLTTMPLAATGTTTAVVVTAVSTTLLAANPNRIGFMVQNTSTPVFISFDTVSSTALYAYELPRKGILEKDNYSGPVTAVTALGSVTVFVTELV